MEFPVNTQVKFVLTADAPMNSFTIPELGGQMYAMAAMTTHLNLIANHIGEFRGQAVEISGPGFSGMNFIAKSVTEDDFNTWIQSVKEGQTALTEKEYATLSIPSMYDAKKYYASVEANLFDTIVEKYMYMNKENNTPMSKTMENMNNMSNTQQENNQQ